MILPDPDDPSRGHGVGWMGWDGWAYFQLYRGLAEAGQPEIPLTAPPVWRAD